MDVVLTSHRSTREEREGDALRAYLPGLTREEDVHVTRVLVKPLLEHMIMTPPHVQQSVRGDEWTEEDNKLSDLDERRSSRSLTKYW